MTKQPEALRLADILEWTTVQQDLTDAAAELRRMHELNEELLAREKRWSKLADVEVARCDKLQAINEQLLEALEDLLPLVEDRRLQDKARAAIAAAKGEA